MYNFRIKKIVMNNGKIIIPKQVNVIIGPNNCGKSQFLKDIKNNFLRYNNPNAGKLVVINSFDFSLPDDSDEFVARYKLKEKIFKSDNNQYYFRNYSGINISGFHIRSSFNNYLDSGRVIVYGNWEDELRRQINSFKDEKNLNYEENYNVTSFIERYGSFFVSYLGTEEKLLMSRKQAKYGPQDENTNFLSEAQSELSTLNELSKYTKKLFRRDVYLDRYSWGGDIAFRVGEDFGFIRNSKRDDNNAELQLKNYNLLDDEGDGLKSFITNFLSLNISEKNILLMDEPESFLHPPLARQLGKIIGLSANDEKQIFISTHSVDLLRGLISSDCELNIIRITRNGNINEINQIERDKLKDVILDVSLASGDVLNGLFSEKVFICEGEADEEFYQFLHDKVNLFDTAFFTHAKNKQTLKSLSMVYDGLKIPNYRIYDFDILYDDSFNDAIRGTFSEQTHRKYVELKKDLKECVVDKEKFHNAGINSISDECLFKNVEKMLIDLKNNGIIILKTGCLETNLLECGLAFSKRNKSRWLSNAISLMNEIDSKILGETAIYNWIFK